MIVLYFVAATLVFLISIIVMGVASYCDEYDALGISLAVAVFWPFSLITVIVLTAMIALVAVARSVQRLVLRLINQ